VRQYGRLS